MIIPVILAGGSGTRLWPLSRTLFPKQLMNLINKNSMLQNTILRLSGCENTGDPIVICNENHRFMVAEQLEKININPMSIILEPVGRNTAPALCTAALYADLYVDDPVLLVLPADHHINDTDAFITAITTGMFYAESGSLITFGIIPDTPETGYGYIKKGAKIENNNSNNQLDAYHIEKFVEKPDLESATAYVKSRNYCWNSGMFMFKVSSLLNEMKKYAPEIHGLCKKSVDNGVKDLGFFRLENRSFSKCITDSIDYAIMEKTDKGVMIPFSAGWNDLGSWEALWQVGKKDTNNNVLIGDVLTSDVGSSYLHATSKLIAAVGLSNHIVVETSDAVLISPRNKVQEVKKLVNKLKEKNRQESFSHTTDYRPWGTVECIASSKKFKTHKLTVKPGAKLSLQVHFHRAEHWVVVKGTADVTKNEDKFLLKEDQSTYIPMGVKHRLENPGTVPLEIIEIQTGSFLEKDDIVRYEDDYGRKNIF